ncbi:odorant receptor 131-2-like [Plectropomus leopardus]|uniref:odorant receptor 131-2-like n=1 Tax=Plectropomus leopardus TaxID=160734 RepID=UPI001C4CCFF1|nr:odorant receptor 131-2-like [Plectropomus leopardus]
MANNNSLVGGEPVTRRNSDMIIVIQVLVSVFLCINFLLLTTFFMKEFFYTNMRYILFATTLLSDCLILILSNILAIFDNFQWTMQILLCLIFCILSFVYTVVTPLTLTAMTLERYVAICMPLRHGELCSTRSTVHCIFIIHGLSSVPCFVNVLIFFASAPLSFYRQYRVCSAEIFILYSWQGHIWSAIYQFYFLIMCITIVFSYIKIMKVAKAASGENKKSTWKGLRTVILHAFQLLLCLIQLWCPFIEAAVLQIDVRLYINVRYFNYIIFYLTPRCLSPLIYGLRDEKFFLALKYYVFCGLVENSSFHLTN